MDEELVKTVLSFLACIYLTMRPWTVLWWPCERLAARAPSLRGAKPIKRPRSVRPADASARGRRSRSRCRSHHLVERLQASIGRFSS